MRAVRDLRDLVNVSRLSYIDSDDDDDSNYSVPSPFSFHSSMDFDQSSIFGDRASKSTHNVNLNKMKLMQPIYSLSNSSLNSMRSPSFSNTTPVNSSHNFSSSSIFNQSDARSSFFKDKSMLFDRTSKPTVNNLGLQSQISFNIKKPLPPLKQIATMPESKSDFEIQPLTDRKMAGPPSEEKKEDNSKNTKNGNFDTMLSFIDASVVSDWLNRANRSLRKMHRWHQDNTKLYERPMSSFRNSEFLKYESFIRFANFWLGCNKTSKLDHKQRRELLEMEYSIICDEVTQAFQIGIDSQSISIADIHRLLHAVFKEYPLQLLSFRGVYMLLDYIDTLSSNRLDEYKTLLSDVKCRTVNKQYAQWLLSIRSFSLINLCWSIVKFYRKTCEAESIVKNLSKEQTPLEDLGGRISSLSVHPNDKTRSDSTSSSLSSTSTDSNQHSRPKSSSSNKNNSINSVSVEFIQISSKEKYDYYLKSALKNDFPEVLHYLITTKKCDPYQIDDKGRTLIFQSVINDLPKILNYLIKRWPSIDINAPCHSGNTALHAAVNQGNIILVELLLNSLSNHSEDNYQMRSSVASFSSSSFHENVTKTNHKLDVNKPNEKCMNTTPLHLAVWNDFNEIAIRLVQSNADPHIKMNETSNAFDLALENDNQVLYELLSDYYNEKNSS